MEVNISKVENISRARQRNMLVKRGFDGFVVLSAMPVIVPVCLLAALAIKLDSRGSVLFRQTRTGLNGQTFSILKFRTMTESAGDDQSATQSRENDARHTRIGRFLRKTSLDELPQLLNVLKGDMSLVGPRPHAQYHDKLFLQSVPGYAQRFRVLPGLTGLAQVNGCRGFIEEYEQIRQRTDYDNEYAERSSLWLDIAILLKTAKVVIKATNAH